MSTETDWNRTIALVDNNTEQVKALREHRDRIGRDLKSAMKQRDRALGGKRA